MVLETEFECSFLDSPGDPSPRAQDDSTVVVLGSKRSRNTGVGGYQSAPTVTAT